MKCPNSDSVRKYQRLLYFEEFVNLYAVLMGYRTVDATELATELAALKYALPKEIRLVLKTSYRGVNQGKYWELMTDL